ncbi:OmpA family protein [Petroclostridium sp. X23]|uniref:OmpA/MotB family protein n=1 Tax=Petroclostridium sp. X23 TaxID=3045146 RepID=UPI0024ADAED0|nr:OmpA family protein [Petroclostridium sp. X23]WHH59356.1 OmpA family protein [Petroclostridium sp. X23]
MSSDLNQNKYEIQYPNSWLITYCDTITIILCFFIIFFILSANEVSMLSDIKETLSTKVNDLSTKVNKLNSENKELKKETESLAAQLFGLNDIKKDMKTSNESFITYLRENNLLEQVDIVSNGQGLLIRFKDGVLFNSGKGEISSKGYQTLDQIGNTLRDIDNDIIIQGFTDNLPIHTSQYPSNWELSVARSINVAKYLIEEKGILDERITVTGYGEHKPIDTNNTPEGRANNRRIEITILD